MNPLDDFPVTSPEQVIRSASSPKDAEQISCGQTRTRESLGLIMDRRGVDQDLSKQRSDGRIVMKGRDGRVSTEPSRADYQTKEVEVLQLWVLGVRMGSTSTKKRSIMRTTMWKIRPSQRGIPET